ncbi:MAG TPA: Uma2 family endonuclease [Actinomycetota bacterium]|nr:Uma2 family endonuclease [Actinomycetota bacterium]
MVRAAEGGYTVDDLDWLRTQLGVAHVELDPWGSLIVTPATDQHEKAVALLWEQLFSQLSVVDAQIVGNGPPWRVPEGSGYLNMPDLTVLRRDWDTRQDEHFVPPPYLVVEIASPSTRVVDRNRKRDDYLLGGAEAYLLVDLPGLAPVEAPTFTLVRPGEPEVTAEGEIALKVAGQPVRLSLGTPGSAG